MSNNILNWNLERYRTRDRLLEYRTATIPYNPYMVADSGIILGRVETFPVPGKEKYLYLDEETGIVYYFKTAQTEIAEDIAEQVGVYIAGSDDDKIYLYIPVRALPIEPLILNCGSSTFIID